MTPLLGCWLFGSDHMPDFKITLQTEQIPDSGILTGHCANNDAWSVGSAILGCRTDMYCCEEGDGDCFELYPPDHPTCDPDGVIAIQGWLNATEEDINGWVEDFYNAKSFLNAQGTYLLLNCEQPIHVGDWHAYNDNPSLQNQIFEAMKKRADIFKSYFPQATVSLGPSFRPQNRGIYNNIILQRIESLERAGDYGVFDNMDCWEPRPYFAWGPGDGPDYLNWTRNAVRQGLDVTSELTISNGSHLPLCVNSSFRIFNDGSATPGAFVDLETALAQLEVVLEYPNVIVMGWWEGYYDPDQIDFIQDLNLCSL